MEADKGIKDELLQLRDALTQVKNNTKKYSEQNKKNSTLLAELTKSLNQLNTLTQSSKAK